MQKDILNWVFVIKAISRNTNHGSFFNSNTYKSVKISCLMSCFAYFMQICNIAFNTYLHYHLYSFLVNSWEKVLLVFPWGLHRLHQNCTQFLEFLVLWLKRYHVKFLLKFIWTYVKDFVNHALIWPKFYQCIWILRYELSIWDKNVKIKSIS